MDKRLTVFTPKMLPSKWRKDNWAYHSVCLPLELARENKEEIHLLPPVAFIPFTFHDRSFVDGLPSPTQDVREDFPDSYCLHLWETIFRGECDAVSRATLAKPKNRLQAALAQLRKEDSTS